MEGDLGHSYIITQIIEQLVLIFGPSITYIKLKRIPGLVIDEHGNLISVKRNADVIAQEIVFQFTQLSKDAVDSAILPLLRRQGLNQVGTTYSPQKTRPYLR